MMNSNKPNSRHEALLEIFRRWWEDSAIAPSVDRDDEAVAAIEVLYAEAEREARLDELEQLINTGWPNETKRYDDGDVAEIVTVEDIEERIAELSPPQQAGGEQHGPSK